MNACNQGVKSIFLDGGRQRDSKPGPKKGGMHTLTFGDVESSLSNRAGNACGANRLVDDMQS